MVVVGPVSAEAEKSGFDAFDHFDVPQVCEVFMCVCCFVYLYVCCENRSCVCLLCLFELIQLISYLYQNNALPPLRSSSFTSPDPVVVPVVVPSTSIITPAAAPPVYSVPVTPHTPQVVSYAAPSPVSYVSVPVQQVCMCLLFGYVCVFV